MSSAILNGATFTYPWAALFSLHTMLSMGGGGGVEAWGGRGVIQKDNIYEINDEIEYACDWSIMIGQSRSTEKGSRMFSILIFSSKDSYQVRIPIL